MTEEDSRIGVRTYLTDQEAREFHKGFVVSMAFFVLVAVIAHFLVWEWRPWFPGTPGYERTKVSMVTPSSASAPAQNS